MRSVRELAEEIVAREGGFVNDPNDPGGPTNFGVTIHTMRRLGLDLTGDNAVDIDDVRALTQEQAIEIFLEHYFQVPGIGGLPAVLQPSVFDMYVNAGSNAVRILQRLLIDMGYDIDVDGQIGPQTIRAAATAARIAPEFCADAYGIARREYYYSLADQRPASRRYARRRNGGKGGWILRAEAFITPRYRLSDAEHRQRTASWV